jgi:hypothetical protein
LDINEVKQLLKLPDIDELCKENCSIPQNHQFSSGWIEGYKFAYQNMYTEAEMKLAFTSNSFHDKFDKWIKQLRRPKYFWFVKYDRSGKLTFDYHV